MAQQPETRPKSRPPGSPMAVREDLYYWTAEERDDEPEEAFVDSRDPRDGFRWLQERVNRAVALRKKPS